MQKMTKDKINPFWSPWKLRLLLAMLVGICLLVPYFLIVLLKPLATPWTQLGINSWESNPNHSDDQYKVSVGVYANFNNDPNYFEDLKNPPIRVAIQNVELPKNMLETQKNQLCLSNIEFGNELRSPESGSIIFRRNTICSPYYSEYVTPDYGAIDLPDEIIPKTVTTIFYYPWEEYTVSIPFSIHYTESRPDDLYGFNIAPELEVTVFSSGWEPTVYFSKDMKNINQSIVQIRLRRTTIYRLLPIILLGLVFAFSCLTIFVQESGSVIEIAVGILFSLWGIRSILLPKEITQFSFVDALIISEYFFLAAAIFIRFMIRPIIIWAYRSLKTENENIIVTKNLVEPQAENNNETTTERNASTRNPEPFQTGKSLFIICLSLIFSIWFFKRINDK